MFLAPYLMAHYKDIKSGPMRQLPHNQGSPPDTSTLPRTPCYEPVLIAIEKLTDAGKRLLLQHINNAEDLILFTFLSVPETDTR